MPATLDTTKISELMVLRFVEAFQTVFSMNPVYTGRVQHLPRADRVSGSVGFGGEAVSGAVYLHLSPGFAARAAAAMLGLEQPSELPAEPEVNDVVGELTNILAGGLKSWLCDEGADCAISTPAIIRGSSFEIESTEGTERICLRFDCDGEPVIFEVHIRFC